MSEINLKNHIFITTPIFYPNGKPHIGSVHTAILGDFLSRTFKIFGYDVRYTTGLDEHGNKVKKAAESLNMNIMEYLNNIAKDFQSIFNKIHIDYDQFIRTTETKHKEAVIFAWNKAHKEGYIKLDKYAGYYSLKDESFFSENEIIKKDNKFYNKENTELEYLEFDCYFLKNTLFKEKLLEILQTQKNFTTPNNRVNELIAFTNNLKDLCISRSNIWGIPVPNDSNQIIYVWFDALVNYLTLCDYPNSEYWHNARKIHIVGKDICIFHGVYWPIILMCLNLPLMNDLLIHNWWISNDVKMSKSLGNVIDPEQIIDKYGAVALRFYCIKENLISDDCNFNYENLVNYHNSFLVNKFSNLVHRIVSILRKQNISMDGLNMEENTIIAGNLKNLIENLDINKYLDTLFNWCDLLNHRVDAEKPWQNIDSAISIFKEIKHLIKFFDAIIPGVSENLTDEKYKILLLSLVI